MQIRALPGASAERAALVRQQNEIFALCGSDGVVGLTMKDAVTSYRYYAEYLTLDPSRRVRGIYRSRRESDVDVDEYIGRDGAWRETSQLVVFRMGRHDQDIEEIDEDAALAVIDGWRTEGVIGPMP